MYYTLDEDSYPSDDMANTLTSPSVGVPWTVGKAYKKAVAQPIVLPLNPERGRVMPDIFLADIPLFSDNLLAALSRAGVDNLQLFEAEIHGPAGEIFTNYKAVNIVGKVACADLDASEYDPESEVPMMNFDLLVIDKNKAQGFLLFRLGEESLRIIIHEDVQKEIAQTKGLVGVVVTPLEVS